ncbi:polysaccharide deacetylase family protein [Luteimonas sp. RIT-PG2_3]
MSTRPRPPASRSWVWLLLLPHLPVLAAWAWGGWKLGLPLLFGVHMLLLWGVFRPGSRLYGPVLTRMPQAQDAGVHDTEVQPAQAQRGDAGRGDAQQGDAQQGDARQDGQGEHAVWLTIDDGPSAQTLEILDLLDRHRARATFFLVGDRAAARPDLVHEIVRRGHDLGNHSRSHPQAWFWALGPRRMRDEIVGCQQQLQAITGTAPRWFRAVVGHANPFVAAPLRELGLSRVAWSARGFDAVAADPTRVLQRIERDLSPGAIVLLHEGAAHGRNVEMIAALLQRMDTLGYRGVLPP